MNTPPHSLEAESAVLGSILMDNRALKIVRGIVEPDDFYTAASRWIYEAMLAMDGPIDHLTLGSSLSGSGKLDKVGGAVALSKLSDEVATSANVGEYAQIVADMSTIRNVRMAAQDCIEMTHKDLPARDICRSALDAIKGAAINDKGSRAIITASEQAPDALSRALSKEPVPGVVMSRIGSIDKISGGFYPKPYLIAGRPSMGKSSLALNAVHGACMAGKRGILVSFEEDANDIMWRLLSIISQVPIDSIYRRDITAEQAQNLREAAGFIKKIYNLKIIDSIMSAQELSDFCEMENEKHKVDFVVVDMLAKARSKQKNTYDRVSEISFELSRIPKLIGAPLIATHQLSRAVESREDKMPMLSDLRDSGKLEEDFKGIFFVMRPWVYDNTKNQHEMLIRVAKNTNGRTGNTQAYCNMPTLTIRGQMIDEEY